MVEPAMATGLTVAEAEQRLASDGPNAVVQQRPTRLSRRILRQLTDPLVALLLAALVVTLALRDIPDAAVIALVVVVNTAIGVIQEVRAQRAIAALDDLSAPTARVIRDGTDLVVPAAEVVRGDVVDIQAGDIVPADLVLTADYRLQLNESALTGESYAVSRQAGSEALAGTVVVTGRGRGVVCRTGPASALGRIAALAATTTSGPTPLQRRLASLGRVLGATVVVLSAVVFALGLAAGRPVAAMAITAVSLVVAAVPESLPAVVTLALALGARRMAQHRAIPRRLDAVETLGSVTVVASDKTGTLTEGAMAVARGIDGDGIAYTATGHGYDPTGEIRGAGAGGVLSESIVELARAGLLCNDAALSPPTDSDPYWRAVGEPMEAALVTFAARSGLDPGTVRQAWPRVAEHPFDQATRRMTTVHRGPDGTLVLVCKGAPEAVLTTPMISGDPTAAADAARDLADAGLRVIAVASRELSGSAPPADLEPLVGLRLLGLVGVVDPVRANAADVAQTFERAGVRLVLITGDHPGTAANIGRQIGIWADGDDVLVGGPELLDPDRVDRTRVFARIQPESKLDIIASLQARGEVVAMTGDGVNDAPALRRADIGIAMGGGTEVARQAADLILVDDNLGTVGAAIGEGRRIYDNIRRFLHYGLAGGLAEILVMLIGPAVGLAVPLLPGQILWVNLLTHGLPGVAMGAEPAEPDVMTRPPRSPEQSILGDGLGRMVLATGAALAVVVLGAGVVAYQVTTAWQSVVFVVLGLSQLGVALAVRAPRTAVSSRAAAAPRNAGLIWAVAVSAALQVAAVTIGPLRSLLGTQPLSLGQLAVCAAVSALPGAVLAVIIHRRRRVEGQRPVGTFGRGAGTAPDLP